jgi:asparagine synthase (glutamine-hydrolysing)
MIERQKHRGPDDQGSLMMRAGRLDLALGFTRLAIIDLSPAGHQPMQDLRAKSWVVFNGEIYNYKELRNELGANHGPWQSQTDTEVLLKAYAHWGIDFLQKLRGMFAFGIWDSDGEQLLLARDGFGIKPLYYYATKDTLIFASEVRALLASGMVPREISPEGLTSYLRFGSTETPLTIINGVRSLSPGHYLTVKRDQNGLLIREAAYAATLAAQTAAPAVTDRREAVSHLRTLLEESVRLHMVSDVPLGAFLSGGIDSSALVALMSRVTGERPRTFTVVFDEKEFSEASYARLIAERFGTKHREVSLSEASLLSMLPAALIAMDQPSIDGINTYVISQAVKDAGITVALSGLGADELFAGYPSFRRAHQLRKLAAIPSAVRKLTARAGQTIFGASVQQRKAWRLLAAGGTPQSAYTISRQLFSLEEVATLTSVPRMPLSAQPPASPETDVINAVSLCELRGYMANTLLRDTDQMSMAHSLEVRVPFVDSAIVPYVLGLKGEWKLDGSRPKPLLLDALGDLLPEAIWQRPKMGFTLPFARWMHSVLQSEVNQTLADGKRLARVGITEHGAAVWQLFQRAPRKERWSRPWSLYVLKKWCDLNGVQL